MKTIVAGPRDFTCYISVSNAIQASGFSISEIVSGGASGVDTLAVQYAHKYKLPYKVFPANWSKYGKVAGFLRNQEMAEYADGLIAFWKNTPGTGHMLLTARKLNLAICVADLLTGKLSWENLNS